MFDTEPQTMLKLIDDLRNGTDVESDPFPPEMQSNSPKQDRKKLPHMFRANSLDAVSAEVAEVLRHHDIGRTKLYPARLLKKNGDLHEGEFFFLNIRELKRGFDPEHSTNVRPGPNPNAGDRGMMPFILDHDQVAVTSDVLEGPDLWLDPTLFRSLFFKGALAKELIAKKLIPGTGTESRAIARCVVVPPA
ncbi:hypothetical protein [Jannaschia pohangensis]|nr:hypothetical protein [Jannaschia pohangensis]